MKYNDRVILSGTKWSRRIQSCLVLFALLLISACTDAGERNNINDYDGDSYAYGDDLYYLNRDGDGFDGEIRQGQVTGAYFIYKDEWRVATIYEMDTYDYLVNEPWSVAKDADNRWGAVITDNCYVFENDKWREGNNSDCSLNLQGCTELRQDIVGLGSNGFWYKCDSLAWRFASNIEKDTVAWGEGKFDGEVRAGKINKDYHYTYVSGDKAWREATDLEKNTYDYEKNKPWAAGKEGDAKWGEVNTVYCYVFEDGVWRAGTMYDCILGLRGCTAHRQDTVALGSLEELKIWYKCDSLSWRTAKDIEKDTATWGVGKFDGEVRAGKVNKDIYYIYESGKRAWRVASTVEKDMYDYEKNKSWTAGKDGEIKKGAVTDTIYVFDATAWRVADNIEKVLGLCVSAIQDSIGVVDSVSYICQNRAWLSVLGSCAPSSKTVERNVPITWTFTFDPKNSGLQITEMNTAQYSWDLPGGSPATSIGKRVVQTTYTDLGTKTATVTVTAGGKAAYVKCTVNVGLSYVEEALGECSAAIQDSVGKVGSGYYICKSNKWAEASAIEYDTYHWKAGKEGDSKWGNVNADYCYVFENNVWREAYSNDCSLGLGGCTALRRDTIGKGSDKEWYTCDARHWRVATTYEKDTFGWRDTTDGAVKKGNVTDSLYIFDLTMWRAQDEMERTYGFCTPEIQDSIASVETDADSWRKRLSLYVCYENKWRFVDEGQACSEFNSGHFLYYECDGPQSQYENGTELCPNWAEAISYDYHYGTGFVCSNGLWKKVRNEVYLLENCNSQRNNERIRISGNRGVGFFICQDGLWNPITTVEYYKGFCTAEKANDTASVDTAYMTDRYQKYYICQENEWKPITHVEYLYGPCTAEKTNDTASADTVRNFQHYQRYYVCQENEWKWISYVDYLLFNAPKFNENISYGTLLDERDGQTYRTVTIGGQEWMAENLNYPARSDVFGTAYLWEGAMKLEGCSNRICEINEPHQGVCPEGWHIPSGNEWLSLYEHVGAVNRTMMSLSRWNVETTDDYGLSIIPVPLPWDYEDEVPSQSFHWSSTQYDEDEAMQWYVGDGVNTGADRADLGHNSKGYAFYVRCVKGEASVSPIAAALGSCSESLADSIGNFENNYYVCTHGSWMRMKIHEYDTVIDNRDGQTYKTVTIGSQTWMAQNLNFDTTGAKCFDDNSIYCDKYGRLYPADVAEKICPAGWHLPDEQEFRQLFDNTGNSIINLKSAKWDAFDLYGFAALPAGKYDAVADGSYTTDQYSTGWWLHSSEVQNYMRILGISASGTEASFTSDDSVNGFSVRCVKDEEE